MMKHITIIRLNPGHAGALSGMLTSASPGHSKFFTPFDFSEESVRNILIKAESDHYYGIIADDDLAGFFMLRGFDEGYKIPAFGVWISEEYQGIGLSKLALHHCFAVCRSNNVKTIMLKVYPDNLRARRLYEKMGFVFRHVDERNGNLVYFKEL